MSNARRGGRRGRPARQKTPEQRRQYLRQIASREASATADIGAGIGGTEESTTTPPSIEEGIPVGAGPPGPGGPGRWGWMIARAPVIGTVLLGIGMLAGAILYIADMKSEITGNTAAIRGWERSQENLEARLRREIDRVESFFEKRLAELVNFLRGRTAPRPEMERERRGGSQQR